MGSRTVSMIYFKSSTVSGSFIVGCNALRSSRSSLRDPIQILVKKEELTLEGIRQCTSVWNERNGSLTHCGLCDTVSQAIIFTSTSRKMWLTESMHAWDFPVSALFGDMDQKEWDVTMREFRSGLEEYYPWSAGQKLSIMTVPPEGQTTSTELVVVVSLTIKVWLLTWLQQKTRRYFKTLRLLQQFHWKDTPCSHPIWGVVLLPGPSQGSIPEDERTAGMGKEGSQGM